MPPNAWAMARARALFAVPGGPRSRTCSPARTAARAPSMTAVRSGNRPLSDAARCWTDRLEFMMISVVIAELGDLRQRLHHLGDARWHNAKDFRPFRTVVSRLGSWARSRG